MGRLLPVHLPRDGFGAGLALVAFYAVLRMAGSPEPLDTLWIALAVAATLASPLCGLTVLAAIGPFTQALTADGHITAVPFLLAALGFSVLLRIIVSRPWPRPSVPVGLAIVLLVGTAGGVVVSLVNHGPQLGLAAAQMWVPGIGGAMTVLIASAWLGLRAEIRPIYVVLASLSVGAMVTIANFALNDALNDGLVGWMLRPDTDPRRVGGLMPAPNATSALFGVGIAMSVALLLSRQPQIARLAAALGGSAQVVALALTFSRSGVLGLGVAGAVMAWHRWRRIGFVVAGAALLVGIGLGLLTGLLREVPIQADQARVEAWQAALRMWLANPVAGAGMRSFEWLHEAYGSPVLNAPHNELLRLFAEEGTLVGLAGLAFAVLTPIYLARTAGWIPAGAGAAAAGLFVVALFNNPFIYAQLNVPVFIVIGGALGIAQRALAVQPPGQSSGTERDCATIRR